MDKIEVIDKQGNVTHIAVYWSEVARAYILELDSLDDLNIIFLSADELGELGAMLHEVQEKDGD